MYHSIFLHLAYDMNIDLIDILLIPSSVLFLFISFSCISVVFKKIEDRRFLTVNGRVECFLAILITIVFFCVGMILIAKVMQ